MKIISGGQTGADRAALDFAIDHGIEHGGWCPKGRWAEDGAIAERYPLKETPSADVAQRTEWNARDSDGTLVITEGAPVAGTALTKRASSSRPAVVPVGLFGLATKTMRVLGVMAASIASRSWA